MIILELVCLHATDPIRQNKPGDLSFIISLGKLGIKL